MKTEKPESEVKASDITVREAGARGGRSTLERRGIEFFRKIGAKGGKRQKELYADLLAEFGKLGGRPRRPSLDSMGEGSPQMKEVDAVGPTRDPSPT